MRKQATKRKAATFTLDIGTIEKLQELSDKTKIPQARLVEMGIQMILDQHENKEQQG